MRRKRTFRALLSTQAPLSLRDPPSDAGGPSSRCHPVAASSPQSGARGALAAWAGACAHARSLDGPAVARSATYAKHTELTAAPPPGLAPAPHGTSRPPATHRETLVPQTSVGAARRPRPLLLPGWGGPGPRHRGRGRDLQGWSPKAGGDFKRTSPSAPPPPVAPEPSGRGAGAASRPPGASQRTGPDARGRGGRRRRGQRGNRRSSQDRRTRWGRRRGAGSGQRCPVASWAGPLGLRLRLEEGVQAGAWQVLRTLGSGL